MGVPGLRDAWAVTRSWPAHLGRWALTRQPGDAASSAQGNGGKRGTWGGTGCYVGLPELARAWRRGLHLLYPGERGSAGLRLHQQGKRSLMETVLQGPKDPYWGWEGPCTQGRQVGTGTCSYRARGAMSRDGGALGRRVRAQGLPQAEHGLQQGKHNPNKQVRIRKELICGEGSRNCVYTLKWE